MRTWQYFEFRSPSIQYNTMAADTIKTTQYRGHIKYSHIFSSKHRQMEKGISYTPRIHGRAERKKKKKHTAQLRAEQNKTEQNWVEKERYKIEAPKKQTQATEKRRN